MKISEIALYKLALKGTITLEQAKILNALRTERAASARSLWRATGILENELDAHLRGLIDRGIVTKLAGIYFSPNFEDKVLEMIENTGTIAAIARITPNKAL